MIFPEPNALIDQLAARIQPTLSADCALIGIHTGGVWLRDAVIQRMGGEHLVGELDVSFYRDDFARSGLHAEVQPSRIPFEIDGRPIILFDDVLYTGRTVRAAINLLFDYGRPASIRLAVLVDRGGRELPICADFTGLQVDLPSNEHLDLLLSDAGALSLVHGPWQEK